MDEAMLVATQQAAWAAQSSAEAAWWSLLVNGLAAVGAVGALWYAIIQGSRTARFERLRAAMEITRILEGVGPVLTFLSVNDEGDLNAGDALYLVEGGVLAHAIDVVKRATVENVPSTQAVSYLEIPKSCLPSLENTLAMPFHSRILLAPDIAAISEADHYFRLLRQVLLRNSWKARRELRRRF